MWNNLMPSLVSQEGDFVLKTCQCLMTYSHMEIGSKWESLLSAAKSAVFLCFCFCTCSQRWQAHGKSTRRPVPVGRMKGRKEALLRAHLTGVGTQRAEGDFHSLLFHGNELPSPTMRRWSQPCSVISGVTYTPTALKAWVWPWVWGSSIELWRGRLKTSPHELFSLQRSAGAWLPVSRWLAWWRWLSGMCRGEVRAGTLGEVSNHKQISPGPHVLGAASTPVSGSPLQSWDSRLLRGRGGNEVSIVFIAVLSFSILQPSVH